ncbi:MAG: hypothetical protein HC828_06630 [Blastochloris sp.]|nr:hypothetical protein [Blastochloris sp.]
MSETEGIRRIANQIAALLGETRDAPQAQIRRIVTLLGVAQAKALADEAVALEANGGLPLRDGSGKHTLGGIFFRLVKAHCTPSQFRRLFRPRGWRRARGAADPSEPPPPRAIAITWQTRLPAARAALAQKGQASDVKITLVGRPGAVVPRQNCVILAMDNPRGPTLPRGLPAPPATPTSYTLYLTHQQWNQVAAALEDPSDSLVVEGWAAFDPALEGIAVFAMFVTTTLTRAQRKGAER